MSDLDTVTNLLEKDCFCHCTELDYMFECMPASIHTPTLKKNGDCYHDKSKEIRLALVQFKTFLETKSKFKIGERVELAYTPTINAQNAWGWMSSRHFLIEGSKAVVKEISYHAGTFGYHLVFDGDVSWIDEKDVIHPCASGRHTFYFTEDQIRKPNPGISVSCEFLKRLWSEFYHIGD